MVSKSMAKSSWGPLLFFRLTMKGGQLKDKEEDMKNAPPLFVTAYSSVWTLLVELLFQAIGTGMNGLLRRNF